MGGEDRERWAEVDLGALRHNLDQLRGLVGRGTLLCVVVKADAYGHGAAIVGPAALAAGADWLAVATVEEGIALRDAGVAAPILVMGPVRNASVDAGVAAGLRMAVHDRPGVELLSAAASRTGRPAMVHLKLETGMVRLGAPPSEFFTVARRVASDPGLELEGAWTHLAEADDPSPARTQHQLGALLTEVARLSAAGVRPVMVHAANSAGTIYHPASRLSMVRCGIAVYGYMPAPALATGVDLQPVLTWKARLVAVHEVGPGTAVGYGGTYVTERRALLGTVCTGYGDGYNRGLSNRGCVLVNGRPAPVRGRVSMDYISVDLTDIPAAEVGDEVVLLGEQGGHRVSADDLAQLLDTVSYEVLCGIGARVDRVVTRAAQ